MTREFMKELKSGLATAHLKGEGFRQAFNFEIETMKRQELIGTWKRKDHLEWMHLRADGTAAWEVHRADRSVETWAASWEYVDDSHWKFKVVVPPEPGTPGVADGAIDVDDFKIVSSSPGRMVLAPTGSGSTIIYERS